MISFKMQKHVHVHLQDVVETHLLRDIAARSENFFQAAGAVQDLRGVLARSYVQVKALRHDVRLAAWAPLHVISGRRAHPVF